MSNARRFRPTFEAVVKLGRVTKGAGKNGPYSVAPDSTVTMPDGTVTKRTVMAFGPGLAKVGRILRSSRTVRLAVQLDGGTLIVVGPAPSMVKQDDAGAAPAPLRTSLAAECLAAAGFDEHANYGA
jgi:hypothetical protein